MQARPCCAMPGTSCMPRWVCDSFQHFLCCADDLKNALVGLGVSLVGSLSQPVVPMLVRGCLQNTCPVVCQCS